MSSKIIPTLFSVIGQLLKSLWKLLLLLIFGVSKVVELVSGLISRLTERLLN